MVRKQTWWFLWAVIKNSEPPRTASVIAVTKGGGGRPPSGTCSAEATSGRRFGPEKSGRRRKESCAVPADPGTELPIRYSGRRLRFAGKANSVPFENCVVERRSFLSFETGSTSFKFETRSAFDLFIPSERSQNWLQNYLDRGTSAWLRAPRSEG